MIVTLKLYLGLIYQRIIIATTLLLVSTTWGRAQILDDSTKQVYGPTTTKYTQEHNIKYNDPQTFGIDTLLGNRHRFNFVNAGDNKLQDLGNVGTAIRHLYPQLPEQIGLQSGFNSFSHYAIKPEHINYYDTKSPYTKLSVAFGGNGRSLVDVGFSRSDSTVLNVGFDFKRITTDKQVGAVLSSGDRNVVSTAYDIYARWHPGKYQMLINFTRLNHQQFESGGVIPLLSGSLDNLFDPDSAVIFLNNALSEESRNNWHIFQQYQVSDLLQIYHQLDLTKQDNEFSDSNLELEGDFFNESLISEAVTEDAATTEIFRNEIGIKGLHKGVFYNFHLTRRDIRYQPKYLVSTGYQTEYYLGANLRYRLGSQTLRFKGLIQDGGSLLLQGSFENNFLEASYTRVQYDAAFMYQDHFGNHGEWHNAFTNPSMDALQGKIKLELPNLKFHPTLTLTNVNDHIYFNQAQRPEQASGAAQILSPEVNLDWQFLTNWNLQTQITYATVTGNAKDVFRIPEWLITTKIAYTNFLFKDKLQAQVGLDTQFRSAYFGHNYDPTVQQFYLQDTFEIPEYLTADFFLNFRVGRALLFAKLVFLNQGLDRAGYFTAPYYLGQGRVFDWGFTWQFYD